jgi:hypothetical protein
MNNNSMMYDIEYECYIRIMKIFKRLITIQMLSENIFVVQCLNIQMAKVLTIYEPPM